jgi:hypothetical protein
LSRPSTAFFIAAKNVEARDKPGHDDLLEHLIHGLLAAAGAVA